MKNGSESRGMTRRELLVGGGVLAAGLAAASYNRWIGRKGGVRGLEVSRFAAMGSYLEISVPQGTSASDMQKVIGVVSSLERDLSVFLPDSELSRINAQAARGVVPVSADLRVVLDESRRIHGLTNGAFDPTVGPLMSVWGFRDGRPTKLPKSSAVKEMLERTGLRRINTSVAGVSFDADRVALDFGGIGQGFGADRAAEALLAAGLSGLVNMSGDIRAAGAQPGGGSWSIGIRNPVRTDQVLAKVELAPGWAISTSGTYEQHFELDGREVTHILDPRTGEPVDGVVSATVTARTAMEADALATAACVMGAKDALRVFGALPGVEALIVARSGNKYQVDATGGLHAKMLGSV